MKLLKDLRLSPSMIKQFSLSHLTPKGNPRKTLLFSWKESAPPLNDTFLSYQRMTLFGHVIFHPNKEDLTSLIRPFQGGSNTAIVTLFFFFFEIRHSSSSDPINVWTSKNGLANYIVTIFTTSEEVTITSTVQLLDPIISLSTIQRPSKIGILYIVSSLITY